MRPGDFSFVNPISYGHSSPSGVAPTPTVPVGFGQAQPQQINPSAFAFHQGTPMSQFQAPTPPGAATTGTVAPMPSMAPVAPAVPSMRAPSLSDLSALGISDPGGASPAGEANPTSPQGLFSQIWKTEDGKSNFDGLESLTKILGTAGTLFGAFQQQKLARDAFNFGKESFRTNIDNQKKTYNTALEDRIRNRYNTEGRDQREADAYLSRNRL